MATVTAAETAIKLKPTTVDPPAFVYNIINIHSHTGREQ